MPGKEKMSYKPGFTQVSQYRAGPSVDSYRMPVARMYGPAVSQQSFYIQPVDNNHVDQHNTAEESFNGTVHQDHLQNQSVNNHYAEQIEAYKQHLSLTDQRISYLQSAIASQPNDYSMQHRKQKKVEDRKLNLFEQLQSMQEVLVNEKSHA